MEIFLFPVQLTTTRIGKLTRLILITLVICVTIHTYYIIPPYDIGSVPSLSGHVIAYRWRSLPRVRRHRTSSPQGSSSNGCCLCRLPLDQLLCASTLFPHPTYWNEVIIIYSHTHITGGCSKGLLVGAF